MGEMNIPFLCGGTFYILLLQALKKDRRIRLNDLDGYKAKEKAINDVTCLKGLVRTFYDFNEHFSDSTFTAHKNQYKLCEKNSTDWLRFETQYLVDAYDKKVRDNYALALEEMDSFIDAFIDDGDLGKKLVRALLEVIDLDRTIDDDAEFVVQTGGRVIDKKGLLKLSNIGARPFLLSVWHFIITKRGSENTLGAETVGQWLHHKTSQAPYKYVGTVGERYALDKEISFKKVVTNSVDESGTPESTEYTDSDNKAEEDRDDEYCKQREAGGQGTNQILNAQTVFNQRAEKIVNIEHVEHLQI